MANERSSGGHVQSPLSRILTWVAAGGGLGSLPGTVMLIVSGLDGQDGVMSMMDGPVFLLLAIAGGFLGGGLGLAVGGVVEWYRKGSAPQG
jgi:hypothetical protein